MNTNRQLDHQGMEHRFGARVPLDAPAEACSNNGDVTDVTLANVSLSRAYVRTGARWPELSRLSLRTRGKGRDWLESLVVRHDHNGVGFEWLDPGLNTFLAALPNREFRRQ